MFNLTKVLITGGCGYIGFSIAKQLLCSGCDTIILFDLISPKDHAYFDSNSKFNNNVSNTVNDSCNDKMIYIKGDICDYESLANAIKKYDIDAVFHVAGFGLSGNTNLPAFDEQTIAVNVFGTQNVIQSCLKNNVRALGKKRLINI